MLKRQNIKTYLFTGDKKDKACGYVSADKSCGDLCTTNLEKSIVTRILL